MSENEIRSRNDYQPELPLPGRPTSLPPSGKLAREISHGLRDIGLPIMCLLAAKWGLVSGEIFVVAISAVLGGNFALRKGEQRQ